MGEIGLSVTFYFEIDATWKTLKNLVFRKIKGYK